MVKYKRGMASAPIPPILGCKYDESVFFAE